MEKIKRLITHAVKLLQYYIDRVWYLPFLSLLAILDTFLVVIPTDGITISSSMLKPPKWFYFALFMAIGSAIGGLMLIYFIDIYGIQFVEKLFPNIQESATWIRSQKFFDSYGLWLVFIISATPLSQQPALILAALAGTPLMQIFIVNFIGRCIKFCLIAYVSSHAPHLIKKLWGVKDELKEVGIE